MPDERNSMGSLLDEELDSAIGAAPAHRPLRARSRDLQARLIERLAGAWSRPLTRRIIMGATSVGAVALGLAIYLAIRPVPKPDYEKADISRIFNYTLLTEEFNGLPVEERIELVGQLYTRVKDMNASESAMMAAFFAGVAGEARDQLERNAGKLLIDAGDLVAKDYAKIPAEERGAYLDEAFVRLTRLTSPFDSSMDDKTDEEILERSRRDADRNREALDSGEVTARQASRLMVFMDRQSRESATVHQQQRLTLFMRDMSRHLRGEKLGG